MKRTRPVFESFGAFVDSLNSAIFEDATPQGGNIDDLNSTLGNVIPKGSRETMKNIIGILNGYMTPESAKAIVNAGKTIEEKSNLDDSGITVDGYLRKPTYNTNTYEYLKDGYVKAKNYPQYSKNTGSLGAGVPTTSGDSVDSIPLRDLLRVLFEYNIGIIKDALDGLRGDDKKDKDNKDHIEKYSVRGPEKIFKDGKFLEDIKKPLIITARSFSGSVIDVVTLDALTYEGHKFDSPSLAALNGTGEYNLCLPIYYVETGGIVSGGGKPAGVEAYTVVAPPTSTSKPEETYTFTSADYGDEIGKGFFGDNDTSISTDGMAELRSLVSKFNKISKIVVSGSASNLSTSRSGGNQKLAEDRRAAGISAIEAIKKEKGAEQLSNAEITEGTASVQPGGVKADPKMRNVTFTVTGELKSSEPTPTATEDKPATITKITEKKFDSVVINVTYLYFYIKFNSSK